MLGLSLQDSTKKLAQKDAELAVLTQQYKQLVTDTNNKIVEANSKLHQLADEANMNIQLANQPEIPVRVSFRKALLNSGNVAGFSNISNQTIAISASIGRPSSNQTLSIDLTIDPGQKKEVGELEGWAFISGDTITIQQPDHKSLSIRAP